MSLATLVGDRPGSTRSEWLVTFDPGTPGRPPLATPVTAAGKPSYQVARRGERQLLFDGELYNREELRHLLGVPPTGLEAELILRAYEVWGRRLLAHLEGEFALVVSDERRKELFAARDRTGSYPLFFLLDEGAVTVSTMIEAFDGSRLSLDAAAIGRYLAGKPPAVDSTLYRGLRRLPPGHYLVFGENGLAVERYWHPPSPGEGAEWVSEDELGQLDGLLERAVLRSAGRGRTALFLSGGIDSVSVAAAAVDAARSSGYPDPLAFSLHYPDELEERGLQRAVAARLGIEHHILPLEDAVGQQGMLQAFMEISRDSAQPLHNPWRPATNALATLAKANGCASVLTGSGGDEWLTVDAAVAADYLLVGDLPGLARYLISVKRSLELSRWDVWRGVLWHKGVKPLLRERLPSGIRPSVRAGTARRANGAWPAWLVPQADEARPESRSRSTSSGFYAEVIARLPLHPLRAIELDEKFAAAGELGLKHHDVYWDADLVEFLCRVPPHLLNRGGRTKGLVRTKLAGRFPGLGFERQKKVVRRNLLGSTVLEEGEAAWKSLEGAQALTQLGIVEPRKLEEFVRNACTTGDVHSVDALWRIFSLESWARPRV